MVFHNEDPSVKKDRPDGLIEVVAGKRRWSALLEAKIGNAVLNADQVERYLRLARDNAIDVVITLSNEFSGRPEHHPVAVNKNLTRRVKLFHLSWASVLTSAALLQEQAAVDDPEQAFLLREFIRYFSHPSAGLSSFDSMPSEWAAAVQLVQTGGRLNKVEHAEPIVRAWHQELRDLSLRMSRIVGCEITAKLSRAHVADGDKRFRDDTVVLCSDAILVGLLNIPEAASDLKVVADLRSRVLRASMTLDAPKERKTSKARVNWLLRQIDNVPPADVSVAVIWASRAPDFVVPLAKLLLQPELVDQAGTNSEIRAFEITLTASNAQRFTGRRTVIDEIELLAPTFYERIGQHLRKWTPAAPKPKHSVGEPDLVEVPEPRVEARPIAGNSPSELLDIPSFLVRPGSSQSFGALPNGDHDEDG